MQGSEVCAEAVKDKQDKTKMKIGSKDFFMAIWCKSFESIW